MVKRELSKEEKDLSKKNIKRIQEEILSSEMDLNYNKDILKRNQQNRILDDKWRDYLRERKDQEDKKTLKLMEEFIEEKKNIIRVTEDQIKNGAETPKAVE